MLDISKLINVVGKMLVVMAARSSKRLESHFLLGDGEPLPGDDDALYLGRPLVDLVDLGVAHQLLHGVLRVEPVPTKDLYSIRGRLHRKRDSEFHLISAFVFQCIRTNVVSQHPFIVEGNKKCYTRLNSKQYLQNIYKR